MKKTIILKELRNLDVKQLEEQVHYVSKELLSLRIQVKTTHVKDYSRFGKFRKIVAYAKTVLREKQLNQKV
jgi:ribosomal protein L29